MKERKSKERSYGVRVNDSYEYYHKIEAVMGKRGFKQISSEWPYIRFEKNVGDKTVVAHIQKSGYRGTYGAQLFVEQDGQKVVVYEQLNGQPEFVLENHDYTISELEGNIIKLEEVAYSGLTISRLHTWEPHYQHLVTEYQDALFSLLNEYPELASALPNGANYHVVT